jgi:hypothetical protein
VSASRTKETTDRKAFYSDDDEQFRAREVRDEDMACWEESAKAAIHFALPGGMNWTMIIRSLIAEVRRLRQEKSK